QFAPFSLYVVHKLSTASTGSEFMITDPNLTGWSYSGSSVLNGFLSIGSATTGLALAYGGCLAGPAISCVAINMFGFSATGAVCGRIDVVPSPTAGGIIKIVDCEFIEFPATGGTAYVNPNGTCSDCNEPQPNATEESTWGKVKSLYR
ncbi:MAG TPA: hypothetical protein VFX92_13910, partial [Candidatus Krumholzibacteria bacterium]|nr:hypothetical protein [Candidatus Krumholzibacteria bacterium]